MSFPMEELFKLLLALVLGGLIGMERELRDKPAGFRTLMFISAGSALFTMFSIHMAQLPGFPTGGDPSRIAAQIVTGVGFLGAGVIMREHGEVTGLTTASTIWLAAALGIGAGIGAYLFSILAALLILFGLVTFPRLEKSIGTLTQTRAYVITSQASDEKYAAICALFRQHGLHVFYTRRSRSGSQMTCKVSATGKPARHAALEAELFSDPEIDGLEY